MVIKALEPTIKNILGIQSISACLNSILFKYNDTYEHIETMQKAATYAQEKTLGIWGVIDDILISSRSGGGYILSPEKEMVQRYQKKS